MRTSVEVRNQVLELNRQEVGIKKISKALGISKNTVRKILRDSGDEKFNTKEVPSWAKSVNWTSVHESVGRGVPVNILHRENVDTVRWWFLFLVKQETEIPSAFLFFSRG
ncbi:MAG: helix-turn-helix domain-containing protein [Pseudobdellovibrionaceae bacterium]